MHTKNPPKPKPVDDEHDMFEYPRQYPSGWQLEDEQPKPKPKKQSMPEDYDKFPEPKTFPDGWTFEE